MKIVLSGYMGSGKSLIGRELAADLKIPFIDLDDLITDREQKSIPKIFEEKGEIYFRKLEASVLKDCLESDKKMVLSLGGGTPCYGNNIELIKSHPQALLFYLKVAVEVLTDRLFKERHLRPLIAQIDDKEKLNEYIRKHLFERQAYYFQSDEIIDSSNSTPQETVSEIKLRLKKHFS